MKISFVVPAYNEAGYIGRCIESIQREIARSKADAEVIVVNNASSDKTGEIARSYSGVIVVDEVRKGLTRARQAGFLASKGDLVANVDADSQLTKDWIDTVLSMYAKDETLVTLSGPYVYTDLNIIARFFVKWFYAAGLAVSIMNKIMVGHGSMVQGGNFIVRRSALEEIGGFDTSIEFYGEDTDIARRTEKLGKVIFTFKLPMYSSARRMKGEGLISTAFKYALNFFWITYRGKPVTTSYTDIRTK